MSQNIKTIPTDEYKAVVKAVQHYVDSLIEASPQVLDKAFHKDATMTGWSPDGSLASGSYTALHTYFETYGPAKNIKTHTDVLSITPTTAVVRLDIEGAPDAPYTDFHILFKIDGEWKIIAKAFHAYKS
ncbi:hypothetical protein NOF04DRAFT_19295 [Fusarium oxysporum II5]|uniref:DUF4440 domain-containing protein n=2 Tax=Fusarium oxysporum species complex TaxID=171631 RepID=X0IPW8_FUSO5|nr:uncharacterized protein FOIG_15863 [Fusarium odoratissimum NRRL 54006]EXL90963.1 hypothetical protein FOIG_15863 [Fusarium odoratissimum NRRL 54006]KAK2123308.1 hypothetical protein NOF04DRAFT_19295 [Fusarium oxysporum II5]TXB97214.1 hypothetical protein FocTR4_00011885 [Fusarium oxysporum f. sp. cubense]